MCIFDDNDRLLKDTDRLSSLKTFSDYISLRFTLTNTITSIPHCPCLSTFTESTLSSSTAIIQPANIDQILPTCDIAQREQDQSSSSFRSIEPFGLLTPTSESDECENISLPLRKNKRFRLSEEMLDCYPLDLSMKKTPTDWNQTD